MQIWLKNHNSCDIFYTSQKCSFIPLCLDFTKFGTLPSFNHFLQNILPAAKFFIFPVLKFPAMPPRHGLRLWADG